MHRLRFSLGARYCSGPFDWQIRPDGKTQRFSTEVRSQVLQLFQIELGLAVAFGVFVFACFQLNIACSDALLVVEIDLHLGV